MRGAVHVLWPEAEIHQRLTEPARASGHLKKRRKSKSPKSGSVRGEMVLVVVPHCDDEVLGFGGAIQKHKKRGDHVTVLFLRQSHNARTRTQDSVAPKAQKILGYDQSIYLGIKEEELGVMGPHTLRKVEAVIGELGPTVVYTTFLGDIHQDHAGTFRAVRMATRVLKLPKVKQILLGEIPSSTSQRIPTDPSFRPNHYEILTQSQVMKKAKALDVYAGEANTWPHPRSHKGVFVQAEYRGMEIGRNFAEAFLLLRRIQD